MPRRPRSCHRSRNRNRSSSYSSSSCCSSSSSSSKRAAVATMTTAQRMQLTSHQTSARCVDLHGPVPLLPLLLLPLLPLPACLPACF
jgi:hypothetical protein